jgi:hypothetical protein
VLDIFDSFFTNLFAGARQAGIKERLRTLKDLDAAALDLATIGAMVLDSTLTDAELREAVLTIFTHQQINTALEQVTELASPPDDTTSSCYTKCKRNSAGATIQEYIARVLYSSDVFLTAEMYVY